MKKYVMQICIIAAVCLLGATAFAVITFYDHYAHEAEQTEAFEQIAEVVEAYSNRRRSSASSA